MNELPTIVTDTEPGGLAGPAPSSNDDHARTTTSGRPRFAILGRIASAAAATGLLLLSFSAFQVWGTDLVERKAQDDLAAELQRVLEAGRVPSTNRRTVDSAVGSADTTSDGLETDAVSLRPEPMPSSHPTPVPGSPIARIQAPGIDLDKTVVEGVGRVQLRDGPGHYPNTPLPGHEGHVAIAGHRTTHGSPFGRLDELEPGDRIIVDTLDGRFVYRVEPQYDDDGNAFGHRIVSPDDVEVIADRGDNRMTLTSCHPRYSNRQRLVVTAVLAGAPVAPPAFVANTVPDPPAGASIAGLEPAAAPELAATDPALGWQWDQTQPTLIWGLLAIGAAGFIRYMNRHTRRRLLIIPVAFGLLVSLFNCFTYLDQLLPAY